MKMLSLSQKVENLKVALTNLKPNDQGFAKSLCDQFAERGLSPKQEMWVDTMLERASPKQTVAVANLAPLVAMFEVAKGHQKTPAVLVKINDRSLRLSLAGSGARVPGSINVTSSGSFANRDWYGRVTQDGVFQPSNRFDSQTMTAVASALNALAVNPVEVAATYGHETGNCCFCGRELTDPRSVSVGYGPICADHWGLPWG